MKCRITTRLMGSAFELIVIASTEAQGNELLQLGITEIKRLEILLTEFSETSETALLNKNAGITPIQVSAEVYELISRCKKISALTQGAFDITAASLKKLYNFKDQASLPDNTTIKAALTSVGYIHIDLQPQKHIFLQQPGMKINFAAIGKGYATDKVKNLWQQQGVQSGVINASGDLTAFGTQEDGTPWKVGIADPQNRDNVLLWLPVQNTSVATSGNYEQFFDLNGIRYSHNIDPRTGLPVKYIKSVSIISSRAELSDALATAVTVMGKDVGLHFINQLPDVHCILIDHDNIIYRSENISINA